MFSLSFFLFTSFLIYLEVATISPPENIQCGLELPESVRNKLYQFEQAFIGYPQRQQVLDSSQASLLISPNNRLTFHGFFNQYPNVSRTDNHFDYTVGVAINFTVCDSGGVLPDSLLLFGTEKEFQYWVSSPSHDIPSTFDISYTFSNLMVYLDARDSERITLTFHISTPDLFYSEIVLHMIPREFPKTENPPLDQRIYGWWESHYAIYPGQEGGQFVPFKYFDTITVLRDYQTGNSFFTTNAGYKRSNDSKPITTYGAMISTFGPVDISQNDEGIMTLHVRNICGLGGGHVVSFFKHNYTMDRFVKIVSDDEMRILIDPKEPDYYVVFKKKNKF